MLNTERERERDEAHGEWWDTAMLLFALPPVSSSPSSTPATATSTSEQKKEGGGEDYQCTARNNGARGTRRGGPNGQSDERCAIIASAKIGSRQDAAGGNITFRGGAQKP